jgi:transposase
MSTTTKSPRKVLVAAYKTAKNVLPLYSHRFSPQKFTLPQLFACLVLKTFLKTDYRGIVAILQDCPQLRLSIKLKNTPHFSTLHKAGKKLLQLPIANHLLWQSVQMVLKKYLVPLAAVDSTGLQAGHISAYFVRRRSREPDLWQTTTYTRFPKLAVVGDCQTHLILAAITRRGPCPDVHQFTDTMKHLVPNTRIKTLLADAGYDSEANHKYARETMRMSTVIPPRVGRPSMRQIPKGRYRRLMALKFQTRPRLYGQRWQVETIFSMIKRRLGDVVHARNYWSQNREMLLMILTHNLAIFLFVKELFYRAGQAPFSGRGKRVLRRERKRQRTEDKFRITDLGVNLQKAGD